MTASEDVIEAVAARIDRLHRIHVWNSPLQVARDLAAAGLLVNELPAGGPTDGSPVPIPARNDEKEKNR